jgi:hypothetical protein
MAFVKINFTTDRIKYLMFEEIKKTVFKHNGLIFGGYVRDMIISEHYKERYNSINNYNSNKFWNKRYQPETAARTIVANDMDICMYSEEDVSEFIDALRDTFNDRVGYANFSSSVISVSNENSYFKIPIVLHKKINYTITIGKIPFVHSGVDISFEFDIIVPRSAKLMPPFNRVDLLCNVFVLNKQGIVMSSNTGTIIDSMSILNRQKISLRIMEDIVEFKTQFCLGGYRDNYTCGSLSYNTKVCERLSKMLFRTFKWDITNMPFILDEHQNAATAAADAPTATDATVAICDNSDKCCICLTNYKNNDKVFKVFVNVPTKAEQVCSIAHDKCMFKYFETQIENAKNDRVCGADEFKFRCPMRNVMNFKEYAENINDIIREKMSQGFISI